MPPPRLPYRWNPTAARYIAPNGRFVPRADVRTAIDLALKNQQKRMHALANQLRGNRITITQWQIQMRAALKELHLYSAAAARGGFDQMGDAEYGMVGQRLREQYRHLDNFAREIENGLQLDGRFTNRTNLYAQSGRATFHEHDSQVQQDAGYTEEHSVLHPADHCASCVTESDRGYVPIGTLIPIGSRTCRGNCRCTMVYR